MLNKNQNGANIIVQNAKGEILVVRQNYGEKLWMLPGGRIERGESPKHAAQEECEEETGLMIFEHKMTLIGLFVQRLGLVALYETTVFEGELNKESTGEILEVRFMSFQQIIDERKNFGVAYLRMIIAYKRIESGLDTAPIERRLVDRIEYPRFLGADFLGGVLLQV